MKLYLFFIFILYLILLIFDWNIYFFFGSQYDVPLTLYRIFIGSLVKSIVISVVFYFIYKRINQNINWQFINNNVNFSLLNKQTFNFKHWLATSIISYIVITSALLLYNLIGNYSVAFSYILLYSFVFNFVIVGTLVYIDIFFSKYYLGLLRNKI